MWYGTVKSGVVVHSNLFTFLVLARRPFVFAHIPSQVLTHLSTHSQKEYCRGSKVEAWYCTIQVQSQTLASIEHPSISLRCDSQDYSHNSRDCLGKISLQSEAID